MGWAVPGPKYIFVCLLSGIKKHIFLGKVDKEYQGLLYGSTLNPQVSFPGLPGGRTLSAMFAWNILAHVGSLKKIPS